MVAQITEDMIRSLMEETGCDRSVAIILLNFTGGDLDGAKTILESVERTIVAVKGKFWGMEQGGLRGFFIVFYDLKKERLLAVDGVVTKDERAKEIDIHQRWDTLWEMIKLGAMDRNTLKTITEDLKTALFNAFGTEDRKRMFINFLKVDDERHLEDYVRTVIADALKEENPFVEVSIEKISPFQFFKSEDSNIEEIFTEEEEEEEKSPSQREHSLLEEEPLIVLKIEPELDPVKGIPAAEVKPGDSIWIRIRDDREASKYLASLLGGIDETTGIPKPIYVPVEEVEQRETGSLRFRVKFGPGILGETLVEPEVRIKTEFEKKAPKATSNVDKYLRYLPYVVAGFLALAILLLIIF